MCRNDDSDVLEHVVPCPLISPTINVVISGQESDTKGWEMGAEYAMLLVTQRFRRCEKPDKLFYQL
jgi:hypothetical protein